MKRGKGVVPPPLLARYSLAMRSLLERCYTERRTLFGCFVILLV
jgi:hypothetical protein